MIFRPRDSVVLVAAYAMGYRSIAASRLYYRFKWTFKAGTRPVVKKPLLAATNVRSAN